MNSSSDEREARKSLFYWRLINIDILCLLLCYIIREDIFEATLSKAKYIVAIIVAVLTFLGLAKGNVLTEGFTSMAQLLGNRSARFTIAIASLAIFAFTVTAVFREQTFTASLAVTAMCSESNRPQAAVPGELEVFSRSENGSDSLVLHQAATLSDHAFIVPDLVPGQFYRLRFLPADSLAFGASEEYRKVPLGESAVVMPLRLRKYKTAFDLSPDTAATLSFHDLSTDTTVKVHHKGFHTLTRGKYSFQLETKDFTPDSGTFFVPEDNPVTLHLNRKTVQVKFIADRGLEKKFMRIPGVVTIHDQSSAHERTVRTDEPVTLEVGKAYSIQIVAGEPWDLLRRKYVGSKSLTPRGDAALAILVIKVEEE
ncbi:MAG: hypothetical protein WB699_04900 [Bacteroidota bacterium]